MMNTTMRLHSLDNEVVDGAGAGLAETVTATKAKSRPLKIIAKKLDQRQFNSFKFVKTVTQSQSRAILHRLIQCQYTTGQ